MIAIVDLAYIVVVLVGNTVGMTVVVVAADDAGDGLNQVEHKMWDLDNSVVVLSNYYEVDVGHVERIGKLPYELLLP